MAEGRTEPLGGKLTLNLTVNGQSRAATAYPMARLLDVLREELRLTGTKEGCGEGECGACSILLDGTLVNSCLVPFAEAAGASITTIEALGDEQAPGVLQQAFIEHGGAQCGICTPGMIMAAHSLLQTNASPTAAEVREALAGNLCRCTGYTKIIAAVQVAAALLNAPAAVPVETPAGAGDPTATMRASAGAKPSAYSEPCQSAAGGAERSSHPLTAYSEAREPTGDPRPPEAAKA